MEAILIRTAANSSDAKFAFRASGGFPLQIVAKVRKGRPFRRNVNKQGGLTTCVGLK